MENSLSLVQKEEEETGGEEYIQEKESTYQRCYLSTEMMKKVSSMAAPMVAVSLSQYLLQVISMVMAGHLDELSLSAVAIAASLTNVTGFSLLIPTEPLMSPEPACEGTDGLVGPIRFPVILNTNFGF